MPIFLGICGQTTFIELGDFSYMQLKMEKKYNIKDILRYLGRNYSNSFIFGNGVSRRPSNGALGEVYIIVNSCKTKYILLKPFFYFNL